MTKKTERKQCLHSDRHYAPRTKHQQGALILCRLPYARCFVWYTLYTNHCTYFSGLVNTPRREICKNRRAMCDGFRRRPDLHPAGGKASGRGTAHALPQCQPAPMVCKHPTAAVCPCLPAAVAACTRLTPGTGTSLPGAPPISFLERRGVQGAPPCVPCEITSRAAAVFGVQWQGDDGGLMFTSASRWRRSRCAPKMPPVKGLRVEILPAKRQNTTRPLTGGKPERIRSHSQGRGLRPPSISRYSMCLDIEKRVILSKNTYKSAILLTLRIFACTDGSA